MRVTNSMLTSSFVSDMQRNLKNMQSIQQQMTSGKLFSKPSDDPSKAVKSMQLYSEISANEQFNSNIDDTINWMDTTDTALGQQGNILQRVRELIVSAGDGSYSSNELQSVKDEINELVGQFSQVMNTSFDGKYIFGGTDVTTKPTTATTDAATGNTSIAYTSADITNLSSKLKTEISQGVYVDYSVSAADIVGYKSATGVTDLRDLFKNIVSDLDSNKPDQVTGDDLKSLDDAINNLLSVRSQVGAKQNRMETAQTQNTDQNTNLTDILSKNEDIDITEKTMEYSTMQTIYLASLQTSAKVLQPSLLDYL